MEQKYYTKKETAAILGVNHKTVERYLLSGKLKGARLGKGWKISGDDIKAFYEAAKIETAKAIKEKNHSEKDTKDTLNTIDTNGAIDTNGTKNT